MDIDVDNVVVFVGDAVRYDYAHEALAERGQTHETIAASLHTPASFGSLLSGLHVPQHGVVSFKERFPEDRFDCFAGNDWPEYDVALNDEGGMNTSIAELFPDSRLAGLDEMEPPFVWIHRDPGGHAPYGEYDRDHDGEGFEMTRSVAAYVDDVVGDVDRMRTDYRRGIEESIAYFDDVRDQLRARGIAEDTLLVYTSDHGELLGEYGYLGHNHLACPELVRVPTTFVHPDIEAGYDDRLHHNVDLLPTIADVLGVADRLPDVHGSPLGTASRTRGYNHFENTFYTSGLDRFERVVPSFWDADGGHAFVDGGRVAASLIFAGLLVKSPHGAQIRASRTYADAFRRFVGTTTYGDPGFDRETARSKCDAAIEGAIDGERRDLSEEQLDHLEDMGYV